MAPHRPAPSWRLDESSIDGRRVRSWVCGNGKQTLVFLHGFGGDHRGLLEVADQIEGFRIVLPDLPGWGQSEPFLGAHTFRSYTKFLNAYLAELSAKPVILAGHSFGGSLALYYAAQQPTTLARLILLEPVFCAATVTSRLGETYYRVGAQLPKQLRETWMSNPLLNRVKTRLMTVSRDPAVTRRVLAHEQSNLAYVNDRVAVEVFRSYYDVDFYSFARRISIPTNLLGGRRDQMTPVREVERLATLIPDCRLSWLPNAGHFAPIEVPRRVASALNVALHIDVK